MYKVYKLTSPSNKVYIGVTCQSVSQRWCNGKGYKRCPAVFKSINKYGWDNFKKEVLFDNLTEVEAKEMEVKLIKQYKSFDKRYGYNLTKGGDGTSGRKMSAETKEKLREINLGRVLTDEQKEKIRRFNLGRKHSEETKRKMSERHKGNKYALGVKLSDERKKAISERELGASNPMARKVICLETMKVYDTLTQAQEETGATKICDCCRHTGKHKSSGGLHWEYYDEQLSEQDYKDILEWIVEEEYNNKHHKMSDENKKKLVDMCSVSVICVETGELFSSIADACRAHNVNPSDVCNCCKGKRKTAKGFHWQYAPL